jgi:hypothetical protein
MSLSIAKRLNRATVKKLEYFALNTPKLELPVTAVADSDNAKIGRAAATYSTQETCPKSCALRGSGCYAEDAHTGIITRRLNRNALAGGWSSDELAVMEATQIKALSGELPLRMHVVGDARTEFAAHTLAAAARNYSSKHGQTVWSYTHAAADVPSDAWLGVSILASCETAGQVAHARARGYATALVVAEHPNRNKLYSIGEGADKVNVVPCPNQQNSAIKCVDCKLCLNSEFLKWRNLTIGFEVHGARAKTVAATLVSIQAATAN